LRVGYRKIRVTIASITLGGETGGATHVERAMGVLMVLTGIGFLTGGVSAVSIWLLGAFPAPQNFG
jgi:hypothetical protein